MCGDGRAFPLSLVDIPPPACLANTYTLTHKDTQPDRVGRAGRGEREREGDEGMGKQRHAWTMGGHSKAKKREDREVLVLVNVEG